MKSHDPSGGAGGRKSGGRRPHDQAWKAMLLCAIFMESLIRNFVEPAIVAAVDLSRLERRSGEYVSGGLRTLRGDIVWRAPWRNRPGHLYFLVEIQSGPDPRMPRRMKRYAIHLPQAADPGEIPQGELPASYPIVLHTDTGKWRLDPAPEIAWCLRGCPEDAAALLDQYQVRQRFRFLSLADMDDAELERMDGIAAHVFRLARTRTLEDLQAVAADVSGRLMAPELAELREPVAGWLLHVHMPMPEIEDARLNNLSPEEFFAMSQVVFNEWKDRYREEGRMEKAMDSALNLLRENVAVETISKCLGLSMEKVRELAAGLRRD